MRIIGGKLGGLRFRAPPGRATRPTADRVREGIASVLEARGAFQDALVLDLFAGTGALSFEALSRGASRALTVDHNRRILRALTEVAASLGLAEKITPLYLDLLRDPVAAADQIWRLQGSPFDLVFADPPYRYITGLPDLLAALVKRGLITSAGSIVIEYATKEPLPDLEAFVRVASYRYGDTTVALLRTQC
jgi:16S rRNA (guanine966-N2)-methyltransferase